MAETSKIPRLWCSARLNLAVLAMLGCICFYSLRVNLSFSVVCMVNHTAIAPAADKGSQSNNSVSSSGREEGTAESSCGQTDGNTSVSYEDGELLWDKEQQGLVLGSIFWGYMLTNIVAGIIATHYGGKRVIGSALFCAAILTATTPVAARSGVVAVITVRVLIGICLGCISPALHALWAQWAPPLESSMLRSFCFAGCQMGYVLTFPVTALLCEYGFDGGWPSVFYVMAGMVLVWCLLWTFLVTDSPLDHPRISAEEQSYIVTSLKGTISMNKVWAAFVCHTCCNWGEYTFLTNIPTYMREVLHFDIKANGLLSSLPYIFFWFVINVSGQVADLIRRKQLMNTTRTRKLFNTLGSLVACMSAGRSGGFSTAHMRRLLLYCLRWA
ncbi:hypothetical protein BaRGS_00008035 [Batillaria attramentaria]|uniref:Major facilitator superfamily (MFS) profile domain-containing protein n=1 Tax=Batillaria attramentaria TaxID=370345 RepID=A0ABD0LND2_9CAEN